MRQVWPLLLGCVLLSMSAFAGTQEDLSPEVRHAIADGRKAASDCDFSGKPFQWRGLTECRRVKAAGKPDAFKVAFDREMLSSMEITASVGREDGSDFRKLHSFQSLEQSLLSEYAALKRSTGITDPDMCEGEVVDPENCTEIHVGSFGTIASDQKLQGD